MTKKSTRELRRKKRLARERREADAAKKQRQWWWIFVYDVTGRSNTWRVSLDDQDRLERVGWSWSKTITIPSIMDVMEGDNLVIDRLIDQLLLMRERESVQRLVTQMERSTNRSFLGDVLGREPPTWAPTSSHIIDCRSDRRFR